MKKVIFAIAVVVGLLVVGNVSANGRVQFVMINGVVTAQQQLQQFESSYTTRNLQQLSLDPCTSRSLNGYNFSQDAQLAAIIAQQQNQLLLTGGNRVFFGNNSLPFFPGVEVAIGGNGRRGVFRNKEVIRTNGRNGKAAVRVRN